jgi:flagellar motor switch protein FliN/FliY
MAEENDGTEVDNGNGEDESVKETMERGERELDFILDIPLELSVELGKTKMLVNDLLQLGQGSIIELNKLAGEPLEVYINKKLIARGEVVVVNEKFGVRLTDVITPIDRVKSLAAEE